MSDTVYHCSICGHRGVLLVEDTRGVRDNYRCENCRSMTMQRDVAQIVVDEFGSGRFLYLRRLVASGDLDNLDIYEVGMIGPISTRLKVLPRYTQSYYWEDLRGGEIRNGVQCQDLRALTFADASFDLIISLEVLEHVFNIEKALKEIERVLKPNGVHIFSIPVYYPFPEKSTVRARQKPDGDIEYLEPERYHNAGDGSRSLLVTDWGADLIALHRQAGLKLSVIRRSAPNATLLPNATFIARKLIA